MKAKLAITGLITCAFLAPVIGHAADDKAKDTDRAHPKAFVKDSAITTAIKTKLAAGHPSSLAKIHVDTDANGVVTLSGTARSQEDIDTAVAVATKTKNVRSVNNQLTIKKDD
jgi:hyperosmotically inducible protein